MSAAKDQKAVSFGFKIMNAEESGIAVIACDGLSWKLVQQTPYLANHTGSASLPTPTWPNTIEVIPVAGFHLLCFGLRLIENRFTKKRPGTLRANLGPTCPMRSTREGILNHGEKHQVREPLAQEWIAPSSTRRTLEHG